MTAILALASHTGWQRESIERMPIRDFRDYLNLLPHG